MLQGYGVLAGSCVRSVPQIIRMNKNKRWVSGPQFTQTFSGMPGCLIMAVSFLYTAQLMHMGVEHSAMPLLYVPLIGVLTVDWYVGLLPLVGMLPVAIDCACCTLRCLRGCW